jgi:hypothetical protein
MVSIKHRPSTRKGPPIVCTQANMLAHHAASATEQTLASLRSNIRPSVNVRFLHALNATADVRQTRPSAAGSRSS